MTTKTALTLPINSYVYHKRYGKSQVVDILTNMGPVIIPATPQGRMILQLDSGCPECPYTELWRTGYRYLASDYKRNLKAKK